jgi:phage terminase large subunit-like protein
VLERRKSIAARLRDFANAGHLTIVDDELQDVGAIVDVVREVKERGLLAAVAVDPAGLGELVDALAEIDVTPENGQVIGAAQGYAMMNAIKTAERKLANGTLRHDGSPLMAWCVGNLKIEPTATAIRATKQNAGDAKIDPIMALFDAVTVMARNPGADNSSANKASFFAALGA